MFTEMLSLLVLMGLIFVAGLLLNRAAGGRREKAKAKPMAEQTVREPCHICHRDMVFQSSELEALSSVEMALAVRSQPNLLGRKLAEHVCPHCEASHCYLVDGKYPVWAGANFYAPQRQSNRCAECQKPLRIPAWPRGAYDHRLMEAPHLDPDYGLVCERCHAVSCFSCCDRYTVNRTDDGTLLCPRCFRGPLGIFYQP